MPLLIGLALALVLTPLCLVAGRVAGLVDRPSGDGLKIHPGPVPFTGGVAVAVAALIGAVAMEPASWWLLAAVAAALALGTVDDVRSLPPLARLAGQTGIGVLLVAGGLRIDPLGALGAVGVVVAVLACTNAVNLVDGQDGLAAGLAAIAAAGLAVLLPAEEPTWALALATCGAVAGFLVFNRPPARIFLGDGGAYALGTVLAVLAVEVAATGWSGLAAAVVCLGVFAAELLTTVLRRLRAERIVVLGDREHAYDLVARLLGSRTWSTFVFWALGAASAVLAVAIERSEPAVALSIALAYSVLVLSAGSLLRQRSHGQEEVA